jgi:hypothetical protein
LETIGQTRFGGDTVLGNQIVAAKATNVSMDKQMEVDRLLETRALLH